jgi:hypothetical protein
MIAGFFTAVLEPFGVGILQMAITVSVFVLVFSSALWIGIVLSAILRTRLGRTVRGKDIGRALSIIIVLPWVAVLYAFMGGGLLEALANPETSGLVTAILGALPSSWGAEIIVGFASNPGGVTAIGLGSMTRFGGLIAFFVGVLWLGTKVADRAYTLEMESFGVSVAKPDGGFYKTLRFIGGGGSFGALLVSVFKDYARRLDNLSKIAYVVALYAMMYVFFFSEDIQQDPEVAFIPTLFLVPLVSAMVVSDVTIRGKEALFIYRKAPSGEARFTLARFMQGCVVAIPIVAVISAATALLGPEVQIVPLLTSIGITALIAGAYVAFSIALFFIFPMFSQKSVNPIVFVVPLVSVVFFILNAVILDLPWTYFMLLHVLASWVIGLLLLYLGKMKLSRME